MLAPAQKYLTLRALGSPAIALSLAMQGVFRGFKNTRIPLYATGKALLHFSLFYAPILFLYECISILQIKQHELPSLETLGCHSILGRFQRFPGTHNFKELLTEFASF